MGLHFGDVVRPQLERADADVRARPARVRLRVERGDDHDVRVSVGPRARRGDERTTDLGAVPSPEAAAFFLALADSADGDVGRRAIMAAVLADSASVWPKLLTIATDTARVSRGTRRDAIFWVGRFAAAKLSGNGEDLAAADDDGRRGDDSRDAAVFALSQLRGHAGVEPLLQVARTNRDPAVQAQGDLLARREWRSAAIALFREILKGMRRGASVRR